MVPARWFFDKLHCTTAGLRPCLANSCAQKTRPKAPLTSTFHSVRISTTPGIEVAEKCITRSSADLVNGREGVHSSPGAQQSSSASQHSIDLRHEIINGWAAVAGVEE